jgi:hypothetical protein
VVCVNGCMEGITVEVGSRMDEKKKLEQALLLRCGHVAFVFALRSRGVAFVFALRSRGIRCAFALRSRCVRVEFALRSR